MEKNSLIRSMSAKDCSSDNSACEGFFGRLKNEFFYECDWKNYSIEDFISALEDYLHWYNEECQRFCVNRKPPKIANFC